MRHGETDERVKSAFTYKKVKMQTPQVKPPPVSNLAIKATPNSPESFRVEIEGPKVMVPSLPEVRKGTDRVVLAEGDRPDEVFLTDEAEPVPQPPPPQQQIKSKLYSYSKQNIILHY